MNSFILSNIIGIYAKVWHLLLYIVRDPILEETGDLRMAQALAGHSDPKTTANYDRRDMKQMRKAAGSLHFPLTSDN